MTDLLCAHRGDVGLAACRGPVSQVTPRVALCAWHRKKWEVFGEVWRKGASVPVSSRRPDPCPTCGHQWFAERT